MTYLFVPIQIRGVRSGRSKKLVEISLVINALQWPFCPGMDKSSSLIEKAFFWCPGDSERHYKTCVLIIVVR